MFRTSRFRCVFSLTVLLACFGPANTPVCPADEEKGEKELPDPLSQALNLSGLTRADLTWKAKGYWTRFPHPDRIPYVLPFFEDLFYEPLMIPDFVRGLARPCERFLVAGEKAGIETELPDPLFQLAYFYGVEKRVTGFRNYNANLAPTLDSEQPLLMAVKAVYQTWGEPVEMMTFGKKADGPAPLEGLEETLSGMDGEIREATAELLLNVLDAAQWRQKALRNVPVDLQRKVFRIRDLGDNQGDGQKYYSEIDDLKAEIDEHSLYYGALKAVRACEIAAARYKAIVLDEDLQDALKKVHLRVKTPIGALVLSGTEDDVHIIEDAAIVVDLGGDDKYTGSMAATSSLDVPVAVLIDLSGNDRYVNKNPDIPSQGAGILGTGVLVDLDGNDRYESDNSSQGFGFFGLGILFDRGGSDKYTLKVSGQGCGYFGSGLCLDREGNDRYFIHVEGQGVGGPNGVGVLADGSGDDRYYAEPMAEIAGRPDYHSEFKISVSNAQGDGWGRRGDGSDGHSWAGGLGALVDLKGADRYESGNWSLGCGYWFGMGAVYDGDGDDTYRSVCFTQASGAHFCIGVLMDEKGDDSHVMWETSTSGMGFGWDFTNALLINGEGDDRYELKGSGLGLASGRSHVIFADLGGDDDYRFSGKGNALGCAPPREDYRHFDPLMPYEFYASDHGFFIDAGGKDRYSVLVGEDYQPGSEHGYEDGFQRLCPAPDSDGFGFKNHGTGLDTEAGKIPEFLLR
ncbi:hypothetical protein ACFLU6_05435 [Acidobacteriota bacterium]